jgi:putative ABC transport system ATP-binding protein
MNNNTVLKCSGITRSFKVRGKSIEVLKGIDLEVFPGELVVIKGRSGEGKSVLQWILSGIDSPTSGEVLIEGVPYNSLSREELSNIRRKKIGLIFQNFNLIPSWTTLENVESALLNSNLSKEEKTSKAVSILGQMELGNRLDNLPAELSAGQQQRVALARALINEPSLIIGDEPTGNVDIETANEMLNILMPYVREKKNAMVVTTHGNFPGIHLADRLFYLKDGKLIRTDKKETAAVF